MAKSDKLAMMLIIATAMFAIVAKWQIDAMDVRACMERGGSSAYCIGKVAN